MRVLCYLWGQRPPLDAYERLPLSAGVEAGSIPSDRFACVERLIAHERPGPPEPGGVYQRLARAIRAYKVFPPRLLTGVLRRQPLQVGDTFGSCFHVLPGVDLFFSGRVTHSFDEFTEALWRAGFAFRTVRGHPMIGEEMFRVEKDPTTGAVRVRIESWSRPATRLMRLGSPFMRWLQMWAVNAALDHLVRLASRPYRDSASAGVFA